MFEQVEQLVNVVRVRPMPTLYIPGALGDM
jgi:hypothetical protein